MESTFALNVADEMAGLEASNRTSKIGT